MLSNTFEAKSKIATLVKSFRDRYVRYSYKIYSIKKIEDSRWWKFFVETIDKYGNEEEWDAYLYVESIFETYGKSMPNVLPQKKTWENYLDYKKSRVKKDTVKENLEMILQDYKKMKKLMTERNIDTTEKFFKDKYCEEMIKRGSFSGLLFSFLRSYVSTYSIEIPKKISMKKLTIYRNKEIMKKLENIFKEDLYVDDVKKLVNGMLS